jgi:lysozyme
VNISQEGIELIKRFEGFSARIYKDVAGYPTIGYGHLVATDENFNDITPEQAETLLREDIKEAETAIITQVTVELAQCQFDALVSFIYNVGTQAFEKSYLLRLLNRGDCAGAADQFTRWIFAGGKPVAGLIARRRAEKAMFLNMTTLS